MPSQERCWQGVWTAALQRYAVPPTQSPLARLSPHPSHPSPTVRVFDVQVSSQVPGSVPQPSVGLHVAAQHSLLLPGEQVVALGVHVQALHTSPVPLQCRVQLAGKL